MRQACARWRGDIGAYVLGALGGTAGVRVRRHLESCARCRGELAELTRVADWLRRLPAAGGSPPARPG